jgi:hypothetical protein
MISSQSSDGDDHIKKVGKSSNVVEDSDSESESGKANLSANSR